MTPKPKSLLEKVQAATKAINQRKAREADPTLKELKRFEAQGIIRQDDRGLWYQLPGADPRNLPAQVKSILTRDATARRRMHEINPMDSF